MPNVYASLCKECKSLLTSYPPVRARNEDNDGFARSLSAEGDGEQREVWRHYTDTNYTVPFYSIALELDVSNTVPGSCQRNSEGRCEQKTPCSADFRFQFTVTIHLAGWQIKEACLNDGFTDEDVGTGGVYSVESSHEFPCGTDAEFTWIVTLEDTLGTDETTFIITLFHGCTSCRRGEAAPRKAEARTELRPLEND